MTRPSPALVLGERTARPAFLLVCLGAIGGRGGDRRSVSVLGQRVGVIGRPLALTIVALSIAAATACSVRTSPPPGPALDDHVSTHIKQFDADDDPIDDPGSPGEVHAIQYAKRYFESLGLSTTIQSLPLVQMRPLTASLQLLGPNGGGITADATGDNVLVWSGQPLPQITINADLVFAGYGIVSPEYSRNDFKDVDVTGKIVVLLEGSPRTGDHDQLGALGETYYGRRFYKFAEGARRGAAGVLLIHGDLESWAELQQDASGNITGIETDGSVPKARIEGWLSRPATEQLFGRTGLDFKKLYAEAQELAFQPTAIPGVRAVIDLTNAVERVTSQQVVAVLPGQTSEYVLVAARWNRLDPMAWARTFSAPGPRKPKPGLAVAPVVPDDGSGAAVIMEAAARLSRSGHRPLRGVVFMVATALKPGILGAEYYIDHPVMPLSQLLAFIFMDSGDPGGTSKRIGKIGIGSAPVLSTVARAAAIAQGRLIQLDQNQDKAFYYTYSQTAFARHAIPTIYLTTRPEDHRPRRRPISPSDPLPGPAVDQTPRPAMDAALIADIATRVAEATNWPRRKDPTVAATR
ncbi:MAG: M28 family peptidase [Acidobacteriota bacterium]